jgi:hypothetical protein
MSSDATPTITQVPDQPVIAIDSNVSADASANASTPKGRGGRGGHGRGGHGRGGQGRRNRHANENGEPLVLSEEQKQKIQARKNINKTFDRKVNTKFAKFMPLRRFQNAANAKNISVTINKGENKVKIQAVIVLSDLAKNKTTIRKESTIIDEIHSLPPYIKNKNLAEKITAKFYKGQGVILNLPEREGRRNRDRENRDNRDNRNDENDVEVEILEEDANVEPKETQRERFQEVDISHILEAAVDLEVKFE